MSNEPIPNGEAQVPDKVLQELLRAFAKDDTQTIVRDDSTDGTEINRLLTLGQPEVAANVEVAPVQTPPAAAAVPAIEPEPAHEAQKAANVGRKLVKIGSGDELPDAVYLDEEGEGRLRGTLDRATEASSRDGRATILIGGDEIEGASGGIPVATGPATMDPRVRARRIAVKREIGRRRLRWVIIGAAVVLVVVTALALLGSSLFAVRNISVSGARHISPELLDRVKADLEGKPVLLVDEQAVQRQLEADPWVRRARVSSDFPHDLSIEIVERVPLATYAGPDGRFRIVDVEGNVVAVESNRPVEFMLIAGSGPDVESGANAGQGITYASQLVEALSPAVRSRTQAVVVSERNELTLLFQNTATVVLGGPSDLLDKLIRLEAVLQSPDADSLTLINVSTAVVSTK